MALTRESVVYANPDTREVYQTPSLEKLTSLHVDAIREAVDEQYRYDPVAYVKKMHNSLGTLSGRLDYALLHDHRVQRPNDLMIMFAPLNDCPPQSSPRDFVDYLYNPQPSKADVNKAQPNSWRQLMKATDLYETLVATGEGMPVAVAFSPLSKKLFSDKQKLALKEGVTTPYGMVARALIGKVDEITQGPGHLDLIERIHLFAPGLGHMAVGAAQFIETELPEHVRSITTPNLILGQAGKIDLLRHYTIDSSVGEAPKIQIATAVMPESAIAAEADKAGSERAMRQRQIVAMLNGLHLAAMYKSDWTTHALADLARRGANVTVPLAQNASPTANTRYHLPTDSPNVLVINVASGVKDKKAELMTNEYVALNSLLALAGVKSSQC